VQAKDCDGFDCRNHASRYQPLLCSKAANDDYLSSYYMAIWDPRVYLQMQSLAPMMIIKYYITDGI